MDLATMQSGVFRGRSKISKYGNARLRRTLWLASQAAVLKPANSFRDKFVPSDQQDRHGRTADPCPRAGMSKGYRGLANEGPWS
ncbi:hypothetical protein DPM13_05150 [Paracoccus mutanolyticus]|uniref:Transposase IS116/IS110/IS902 C-terminal domain-containing protein n=1 Tax=Paracoccus mutanolyticus TaxID=1499308 RepID=A0ABN5M762_9RHOB|nr:hypothetical protein DPM13_05150 [Paracoccus mutanolyticus]